MKISINKTEFYSIEVPDEVDNIQFFGLQQRFERIAKLMSKDVMSYEPEKASKLPKVKKHVFGPRDPEVQAQRLKLRDRSILIKLFKAYYSSDKEELFRVAKELGVDGYVKTRELMSSAGITKLRDEILVPRDIGLIKYPGRKGKIDELRI